MTIEQKKEVADKHEKRARIHNRAAEYCMEKCTVVPRLKNKVTGVAMCGKKQLKQSVAVEEMKKIVDIKKITLKFL